MHTSTIEEQLNKPNLYIVDARASEETAMTSDFIGAKNIPPTDIGNRLDEMGVDKSRPILVYYGSATKTGHAEKNLKEHGYTDIVATSNPKAFEPHLQKWRVLSS